MNDADRLDDGAVDSLVEYDCQARPSRSGATASQGRAGVPPELAKAKECLDLIARARQIASIPVRERPVVDDASTVNALDQEHDTAGEALADDFLAERPSSIGRFGIQRELGRGGYGIVFLADDPQLQREVALKIPRPEVLLSEDARSRFAREAESAALLDHPGIVPVYETGRVGYLSYIVYAYSPGETLGELLHRRADPVATTEAAALMIQLCEALQHAHSRGILHRDLKPGNVLCAEQGPRITDFGLAKAVDDQGSLTVTGAIIGTPQYSAPEVVRGEPATTSTDLYSLGVILYELLTGRTPFAATTRLQLATAIAQEEPPSPRRFRSDLPRDLEAICLKCLEKDPAQRFHTVAELRDDLRRYLQGVPVQARHVGSLVRTARWCRRRPGVSTMIGLLLISLVAGGANVMWQWSRAERHLTESQRERRRAINSLQSAQQAIDELLTEVAEGLADTPQLQALRRNLLLKAAKMNEQLLNQDRAEGELRIESIRAWRRAADIFGELKDDAQQELAIQNGMRLAALSDSATATAEFARLHRQRGDLHRAHQSYEEALADYQESTVLWEGLADERGNPECRAESAENSRLIGLTLAGLGRYDEAEPYFEQAVAQLHDLPEQANHAARFAVYRVSALRSLGNHYRRTGRRQPALQEYQLVETALERLTEVSPLAVRYQQQLAELRVNIGDSLRGLRRYDEAVPVYDAAEASLRRLANHFPLSPSIRFWLAKCCMGQAAIAQRQDRMQECEQLHQEASETLAEIVEQSDDRAAKQALVNALGRLSKLRRLRDDLDGSENAALSAVELAAEIASGSAPGYSDRVALAIALFDAARLKAIREDNEAAVEMLGRSAEIRSSLAAANPDDFTNKAQLAMTTAVLSSAEMALGRYEYAADHLSQVPEIAPDSASASCITAIGWLQMAYELERLELEGAAAEVSLTVEQCRQAAITQLNRATELEDFDLASITRMESFSGLMQMPKYRAQLAAVYQEIDLSKLPPPMTHEAAD